MTRLIDADALNYVRVRIAHDDGTIGGYNAVVMSSEIKHAPTIEAEPVRHGKWACDAIGVLRCSECKAQAPWRFVGRGYNEVDYRWKSDYCPHCGARMDEE